MEWEHPDSKISKAWQLQLSFCQCPEWLLRCLLQSSACRTEEPTQQVLTERCTARFVFGSSCVVCLLHPTHSGGLESVEVCQNLFPLHSPSWGLLLNADSATQSTVNHFFCSVVRVCRTSCFLSFLVWTHKPPSQSARTEGQNQVAPALAKRTKYLMSCGKVKPSKVKEKSSYRACYAILLSFPKCFW